MYVTEKKRDNSVGWVQKFTTLNALIVNTLREIELFFKLLCVFANV